MNSRSKNMVGVGALVVILFIIFMGFGIFTVGQLAGTDKEGLSTSPIKVVKIEGVIMESREIVEQLIKAEEDPTVKAIIVRIESPGGAVGPSQEIYEEIKRIDQNVKPVYASFGAVAASGGYYIGAATRKIFANAGTLTGSIGVIMQFVDLSRLFEMAKVKPETVKAGKYKDIGNPSKPLEPKERLLLNQMVENVHEQFIKDILATRKDKIKGNIVEHAQGQIFSGQKAYEVGLVDEIAGLWAAGRMIHKELKLPGKFKLSYSKPKKKLDVFELLQEMEQTFQGLRKQAMGFMAPMFMSQL